MREATAPPHITLPCASIILLRSTCASQSDAGLRGIAPGICTISYLAVRRRQLKLLNATLLAGLSLAARGVDAVAASLVGVPAGCLSLLLLASTVASAIRQVRAEEGAVVQ